MVPGMRDNRPMPRLDDDSPGTTLFVALVAMLAVALLIGAVVAGGVLGLVRVSGIGEGGGGDDTDAGGLVLPSRSPEAEDGSGDAGDGDQASGPDGATSTQPQPSPTKRKPPIRLRMSPRQVGPGERITLTGTYPRGSGQTLQVQRRQEGSWVDFPVTAQVSDQEFTTWIQTTRTGRSPFRVFDKGRGRASNVVVIAVG